MSNRPFKCGKCGNWYIGIPMPDDTMCRVCAEGKHAVNPKTGGYDCHWGQVSPMPSEIKMVELLALCQQVGQEAQNAMPSIQNSTGIDSVKAVMSRLEQSFAKAELAQAEMPEILRWAVVMELPGMQGSPPEARFKNIDAIRTQVESNRRPPEDLAMLERSEKVCREIAAEIPGMLSDARMNLGQARQAAQAWRPAPQDVPAAENAPSTPKVGKDGLTNAQRMAKARAAKKPRELVNA